MHPQKNLGVGGANGPVRTKFDPITHVTSKRKKVDLSELQQEKKVDLGAPARKKKLISQSSSKKNKVDLSVLQQEKKADLSGLQQEKQSWSLSASLRLCSQIFRPLTSGLWQTVGKSLKHWCHQFVTDQVFIIIII